MTVDFLPGWQFRGGRRSSFRLWRTTRVCRRPVTGLAVGPDHAILLLPSLRHRTRRKHSRELLLLKQSPGPQGALETLMASGSFSRAHVNPLPAGDSM